jgi:hypothetical protein
MSRLVGSASAAKIRDSSSTATDTSLDWSFNLLVETNVTPPISDVSTVALKVLLSRGCGRTGGVDRGWPGALPVLQVGGQRRRWGGASGDDLVAEWGRLSYALIRVTNANSIRRYFYRPASPGVAHTSRRMLSATLSAHDSAAVFVDETATLGAGEPQVSTCWD